MLFDIQKYVYSESLFKPLYIELKHKYLINFCRKKETVLKMSSFIPHEVQLIIVLLLICYSYKGFSIFDSVSGFF